MNSTMTQEKSTHICKTFRLTEFHKHPNADKLSLIKIPDSLYVYVANTEQWKDRLGKMVAWIPPESLVPFGREEFNFLAGQTTYNENSQKDKDGKYVLIKAIKLRNVLSYGLLTSVPETFQENENAAEYLGVIHYDGEFQETVTGDADKGPSGCFPKYDVDSFMNYSGYFEDNELTYIWEKLNGENTRVVFTDKLHIGSRNLWKKESLPPPNITVESLISKGVEPEKAKELYEQKVVNYKPTKSHFWIWQEYNPGVVKFCEEHPGYCVYGECYGGVKGFPYDVPTGKRKFAAFDILKPDGTFYDSDEFLDICQKYGIITTPLLARDLEFNRELVKGFTEGNSTLGKHIKEGIVIKPVKERYVKIGRLSLKLLSDKYMEMKH